MSAHLLYWFHVTLIQVQRTDIVSLRGIGSLFYYSLCHPNPHDVLVLERMNDGQVPVQCHPDEEENGKDCDVEGDDVTDQTDHLVALVRHLEVERDVEGDVEAHQKVRHGQGRHEQVV